MGLSLVTGEYSRNGCGDRHAKINSKIYIHAVLEAVNRVRNTRHETRSSKGSQSSSEQREKA